MPTFNSAEATIGSSYFANVLALGEGGDFNHKCRCGEQNLNLAVNIERSTAPPLLPSMCYALVAGF